MLWLNRLTRAIRKVPRTYDPVTIHVPCGSSLTIPRFDACSIHPRRYITVVCGSNDKLCVDEKTGEPSCGLYGLCGVNLGGTAQPPPPPPSPPSSVFRNVKPTIQLLGDARVTVAQGSTYAPCTAGQTLVGPGVKRCVCVCLYKACSAGVTQGES